MLDGAVFFAIIEEENEVIWMVQDRNPEYFLAIASEKSISKAAERLHISQPYLSQYVIHLEKEFGVRLLDRTKSPLALTAAGKVYANYLEDSSQLYEQLLQDFTRLNASRRQTLRVAMSNWRASTLLPSILPAFSQEHPEAHLELLERPTSEMFRLVADNTVDFAIMNTNLNTPDYLTTETILYEKILLSATAATAPRRRLRRPAARDGSRSSPFSSTSVLSCSTPRSCSPCASTTFSNGSISPSKTLSTPPTPPRR